MQDISTPLPRADAPPKSSGAARYLADMRRSGCLTARLVLSTRPHARITGIDLPEMPAGYLSVDYHDVPGTNAVHMIKDSWPLFPENVVHYVGQPILLVAGPDPRVVRELANAVDISYVDEEPVFGIDGAEALPDPDLFVEYRLQGSPGPVGQKVATSESFFLEETFDTGPQEHVYLEPQAVLARYEDGRMTVSGSMQCPYYVKGALSTLFGWEDDRIRVVQTTTGGAFGGKEEFPSVLAGYVAVAAYKSGKPVQLVLDRSEDIRISTKRHPSRTTLGTSVSRRGRLLSTSADIRTDGGAFEGLSSTVLQRAIFSASGVYRVPEISVRGRSYRTNVVPYGAFRGFGSPQAFFAVEMHMTHLARRRGEDPLVFKRRQLLEQGDRTITGGTLRDPVVMEEMISKALEMSDYARKRPLFEHERSARPDAAVQRGIGVSLFNHGCGFTGSGERDIIKARVRLQRTPDHKVTVFCSNVEMGQGAETTLRKIVAQTLAIGMDAVEFQTPDTDRVPDSGPTVASRTVMVVGGLLQKAALELKERWTESGAIEAVATYEQPEEIEWDQETFTGDAYPAFSWGVNIVEVEVDLLTFEVRPLTVWAVYDIGTAIDERVVMGQIHGGIVQGLGYATTELLEIKQGVFQQQTMTDYVIPGSLDVPAIEVRLIPNPYKGGPFGAKGVGEIPLTGAAPALADAVECALGIQVYQIPLTPEYLERLYR